MWSAFITSTSELTRRIHSYTYGVANLSDRVITTTLDASKSRQMQHSVDSGIVTKVD